MPSVYRRGGRGKKYFMEFKDQYGTTRKNVPTLTTDKAVALTLVTRIEADAARMRTGLPPEHPDVTGPYLGMYLCNRSWDELVEDYDNRYLLGSNKSEGTRQMTLKGLKRFGELMKPRAASAVDAAMIADFVVALRQRRGRKKGSKASAANINRELRQLKAALRKGKEWGYLHEVPHISPVTEHEQDVRYVTPEHFAAIYQACDRAGKPAGLAYPAGQWWQGLLMLLYVGTGWRIGQALALRREALDLHSEVPTAFCQAKTTKRKRAVRSALPPVVVEHLRRLDGPGDLVFPWPHHRRTLDEEWADIQEAAGVRLACVIEDEHEHSRHCYVYGFHDLRRGFATMNADRLTPLELQLQMQHRAFTTTQGYINLARQLKPAAAKLYIPPLGEAPPAEEKGKSA